MGDADGLERDPRLGGTSRPGRRGQLSPTPRGCERHVRDLDTHARSDDGRRIEPRGRALATRGDNSAGDFSPTDGVGPDEGPGRVRAAYEPDPAMAILCWH